MQLPCCAVHRRLCGQYRDLGKAVEINVQSIGDLFSAYAMYGVNPVKFERAALLNMQ
jgi:hypothetical protein